MFGHHKDANGMPSVLQPAMGKRSSGLPVAVVVVVANRSGVPNRGGAINK